MFYEAESELSLCWVDYFFFSCGGVVFVMRHVDSFILGIDSDPLVYQKPNMNQVLVWRPANLLVSYMISYN